MSRSRRRISRLIAVVLVVGLGVGIFVAAQKIRASRASAAPGAGGSAAVDSPLRGAEEGWGGAGDSVAAGIQPLLGTTQTPAAEAVKGGPAAAPALAAVSPQVALAGNPLVDGQSRLDAGDPLGARRVLNDALAGGRLADADAALAKAMMARANQELVFGRRAYKDDPAAGVYAVQPGDRLARVAAANGVTWELLCRINGISDPRRVRAGQTLKLIKGPFHAVVTKSKFTMDLYLGAPGGAGSTYVTTFPVGLGKDDSTPVGTWVVDPHKKLKNPTYFSPRGEGVIAADDPKNPLGEFWIGLAGVDGLARGKMSYGIHGTIEPDSIGKEESMGCIRLRNEDVALVFEMLVEGKSKVVIRD